MGRQYFLIATAALEAGAGLFVLALPATFFAFLLGDSAVSDSPLNRLAGVPLLALGVACWLGRNDPGFLLMLGVLAYDVVAAAGLAYAGLRLNLVGPLLWPAVGAHTVLAAWCVACRREKSPGDRVSITHRGDAP